MERRFSIYGWLASAVVLLCIAGGWAASHWQARQVAVKAERDFPNRLRTLETQFEQQRKQLRVPGAALVVVRHDRVVCLRGFGLRDVEHRRPVTPETLFGIGSCTKAFTAMAAMITADRRRLSLEGSPRKFLPYFRLADPEANAKVTLRDLLAHRTGLKAFDDGVWHKNDRLTREAVIRAVMLRPAAAPFRKEFLYNNVMYAAAGECIGKANGSSWERVITDELFAPLGMTRSTVSLASVERDPDAAVGYAAAGKYPKRERRHDLRNVAPAGGIYSSARDMGQWLRLMLARGRIDGRRLVSEAAFREVVTPQMPIEGNASYGLGWELGRTDSGVPFINHAGGAVGHASHVWISPEQDTAWAVLANVNNTRPFRELTQLVDRSLLP